MNSVEKVYDDFLYDCHLANKLLTPEEWEYFGKENHHIDVPNCEGGLLTPLNSQPLTTYQHWGAGVLQSEVVGRKCFAFVPKGVLPEHLERIRIKWDASQLTREHQVNAGKCIPREHLVRIASLGGSKNKGKIRGPHKPETRKKIGDKHRGKKVSLETRQKMSQNCFKIDGWIWVTNGSEETMIPPDHTVPEGWKIGRKEVSEKTRRQLSQALSGSNNPMYGVEPKTKQMRWYKNLKEVVEKMFVPGEEPTEWVKGRLTAQDRR